MRALSILMRGVVADNAQAIHDAHAVTILRQQIRDAAGALATARRELAVAMAYHAAEARALDAIGARIASLSDGARRALADGREDLGREAAGLIAALEDERADRRTASDRFAADVERLRRLVAQGGDRLRDLDPRAPDRPDHRGAAAGGTRGTPGHGAVGRGARGGRADAGAPARATDRRDRYRRRAGGAGDRGRGRGRDRGRSRRRRLRPSPHGCAGGARPPQG